MRERIRELDPHLPVTAVQTLRRVVTHAMARRAFVTALLAIAALGALLDCGLFHTFDGDERTRYVASLGSVTERGGTLYVLCFSDEGPETGPHPIRRHELRAAFDPGSGWDVAVIEPDRVETRFHDHGAPAWLATIRRSRE